MINFCCHYQVGHKCCSPRCIAYHHQSLPVYGKCHKQPVQRVKQCSNYRKGTSEVFALDKPIFNITNMFRDRNYWRINTAEKCNIMKNIAKDYYSCPTALLVISNMFTANHAVANYILIFAYAIMIGRGLIKEHVQQKKHYYSNDFK